MFTSGTIILFKLTRLIFGLAVICISLVEPGYAQEISFRRLNTSHGLSDNLVNTAMRDRNGILWIATSEGLNSFDGYKVEAWQQLTDRVLQTRNIRELHCDALNRVWLMTPEGEIALLDKHRRCSKPSFEGKDSLTRVHHMLPFQKHGMVLLSDNRLFKNKKDNTSFSLYAELPDSLFKGSFQHVSKTTDEGFLLSGNGKTIWLDGNTLKVKKIWQVPDVTGALLLESGDLLVSTSANRQLYLLDANTGLIKRNYATLTDQYGKPINGFLRKMSLQADGRVVLASGYGGVYLLNPDNETLFNYRYSALDPKTVPSNSISAAFTDTSGYVYLTTREAGLCFYNIHYTPANLLSHFRDEITGNISGGYIGPITQHRNGHYWVGAQNGLIEWDKAGQRFWFHEYGIVDGEPLAGREAITGLAFDNQDRLWVGTTRYGLIVLDKNGKPIQYLNQENKNPENRLPANQVSQVEYGPDGLMWIATQNGLCMIDPVNFTIKNPYPQLDAVKNVLIFSTWFRNTNEVWIGTTGGAFRYRFDSKTIRPFTTNDGLLQNRVSFFGGDSTGNVYMCSRNGLYQVSANDKIKFFNTKNGLLNEICTAVQTDELNHVWIANDNFLLSFNPSTEQFTAYDESVGISGSGFRNGKYRAADGTLFWGGNDGISFFKPAELLQNKLPVSVWISSLSTQDSSFHFTQSEELALSYTQNDLLFNINPVSLFGSKAIKFRFMLQGIDQDWQQGSLDQVMAYQNLPPGNYKMQVMASVDGKNWLKGSNEINISIAAPWWRKSWFMIICVLAFAALVFYFWNKKQRVILQKKEAEETERAIHYFAASMHQHSSVNDILWDITRNCISRLNFEDCVIYLLNTDRQVLHQQAAWGPKSTGDLEITNPLEISMDNGIVGAVASSGKPELVNDTSLDDRYIVDDIRRYSEICVPIIADGKVLGVIDSEHSRKNFFTSRHLSILTTIASLVGSKIVSAKAEEERRNTALQLLENQRRISEVEMQALRAQMNPHFMFNSLNSINNFILKNDADNASAYLTRFARLMRLILDNSRQDWISLENELKALQLYIEMESLRFDNVFEYQVVVSPQVDQMLVLVPPMIIQPYVENAIWHGLLHRQEKGSYLSINIEKKGLYLEVKITDNGVGREAAQRLKSKFGSHKKSHGMQITQERLEMVNAVFNVDAQTNIQDLTNEDGAPAGTIVILTMKYKTNEGNHY